VHLFRPPPPLTLYNSLLAFMLVLLSLQSKAISSSSLSLSQISSSVQCDTNACRLSKLRRRHDECSYGNHTNIHHRHANQRCREEFKKNKTSSFCWFWYINVDFKVKSAVKKETKRNKAKTNQKRTLNIFYRHLLSDFYMKF